MNFLRAISVNRIKCSLRDCTYFMVLVCHCLSHFKLALNIVNVFCLRAYLHGIARVLIVVDMLQHRLYTYSDRSGEPENRRTGAEETERSGHQ